MSDLSELSDDDPEPDEELDSDEDDWGLTLTAAAADVDLILGPAATKALLGLLCSSLDDKEERSFVLSSLQDAGPFLDDAPPPLLTAFSLFFGGGGGGCCFLLSHSLRRSRAKSDFRLQMP